MPGKRELVMPKIGLTMTEGTVSEWPIPVGQRFDRGAIFAVVETDKVANDLEAPAAGRLTRIVLQQGETAEVGTLLAEWEEDEAQAVGEGDRAGRGSSHDAPESPGQPIARELGLRRPATATELTIARRLVESKQTIPHFYMAIDVEVSALQAARHDWNGAHSKAPATITHALMSAVARALAREKSVNRVWDGEGFVGLESVDIGLAIDVPSGLVAPVLRGVDRLSLVEVVRATTDLVDRARSGKLRDDDFKGGMVTISNAGMHGIRWMASIINPGQSAILGVGGEQRLFRPDPDCRPALAREITLVLSCDHRALDGVQAARLLGAIRAELEAPEALFA